MKTSATDVSIPGRPASPRAGFRWNADTPVSGRIDPGPRGRGLSAGDALGLNGPLVWVVFAILILFALPSARAVYAPIPQVEQGKPLTVYLGGGIYYDTNIFGAETGRVGSMVYQLLPSLAFNASVQKQTFASLNYRLSLDYIADRPGKKLLDSHELVARLAHTFTPETEIDITDSYQLSKNPESLLPGVGTLLTGDQSFHRNQFDTRFTSTVTRRNGVLLKARVTSYRYVNDDLARDIDRDEFLGGITAAHTLLPTLKATTEYRYQDIRYRFEGSRKDKVSNFLLGGADYALNARVAVSGRLGFEYRERRGDRDQLAPYIELGAKRDYAKGSFVSLGYSYSIEETTGVSLYTDMLVNRFFINWQHVITPKLTGTASLVWEPSLLRGRRGIAPDADETNTRLGTALVFRPFGNWSVAATLDVDRIHSDQPGRGLNRERIGLSVRYAF